MRCLSLRRPVRRVEIGAVERQEDQVRAPGPDGGAGGHALVIAAVVEDSDVAGVECWGQNLHDIDPERSCQLKCLAPLIGSDRVPHGHVRQPVSMGRQFA